LIRPREDLSPIPAETAADDAPAFRPAEGWNPDRLPPELEYFRTSQAYKVELDIFQGPLDLLLYLIQKDRMDIYDIPVARITDQFLAYLEIIKMLPLDNAGDFLVMAATLLRIKTRMLLPTAEEEELEEEDPRAELVQRLLEYKRFKEAARILAERESERRRYHLRASRYPFTDQMELDPPLRIEMFDLLRALAGVFDRLQSQHVHTVRREPFTVEQKIHLIRRKLGEADTVRFEELFAADAIKMEVIVTFIAILELVKRRIILMYQSEIHGPIWLRRDEEGFGRADTDEGEAADGADETAAARTLRAAEAEA
jgi:segregation and condensation protein A